MIFPAHCFKVSFGHYGGTIRELRCGEDFRLDEFGLQDQLCFALSPRVSDLMRIAMSIYVIDRLVKRRWQHWRDIDVSIEVSEPDFWRGQTALLQQTVEQLSGSDRWNFEFKGRLFKSYQKNFQYSSNQRVVLYSGGLDSAAGLASLLQGRRDPTVMVTALHQATQRDRVARHRDRLSRKYCQKLGSVEVKTTLISPPPMGRQELTQRSRSFLFAALGGAVAFATEASEVEFLENGNGIVNVPLMTGMMIGARTTRSCHPKFLHLMSDLVSNAVDRRIDFVTPFQFRTKAEMVRVLAQDGLTDVLRDSVSCVHFPLREKGPKQCGLCPACIGRRQAIIAAGLSKDTDSYQHDVFSSACRVSAEDLQALKATILQLPSFSETAMRDGAGIFQKHIRATGVLDGGSHVEPLVDLFLRYRREWLRIIAAGQADGLRWATLLQDLSAAA